jgi:hypothetical protein
LSAAHFSFSEYDVFAMLLRLFVYKKCKNKFHSYHHFCLAFVTHFCVGLYSLCPKIKFVLGIYWIHTILDVCVLYVSRFIFIHLKIGIKIDMERKEYIICACVTAEDERAIDIDWKPATVSDS